MVALAKIAREGFLEAFKLYFEPLRTLWAWWKRFRFFNLEIEATSRRLEVAVAAMETTAKSVDDLMPLLQLKTLPSQVAELGSQAESFSRRLRALELFIQDQPSRELEVLQTISKILRRETQFMTHDLATELIQARQHLSEGHDSFERAIALAEATLTNRPALPPEEDIKPVVIRLYGVEGMGKTSMLNMLQVDAPEATFAHWLETIRGTPELGLLEQPAERFGIYLEVASFLAQQGFGAAAAAVMARAFRLTRSLEAFLSGRGSR
jgi:hypothetical protein